MGRPKYHTADPTGPLPEPPATREAMRDMLLTANAKLATLICQRIDDGDIGSYSWLKEARGFLKDQGITLSQLPSTDQPLKTDLKAAGIRLFTPGVHHHDTE